LNIKSVSGAEKLIANSGLSPRNSISTTDLTKEFGSYLNDALNKVNNQHSNVEHLREKFMTGQMTDPHTLMIASEKASLGLELTIQVRNKVIEAYQEIMRTQI
jgi:flagellar hook-basal body complex protein FliE